MPVIHSSAIVDSSADLDDDVEVGPYTIIGPKVKIRAGTNIMAHVFLDGDLTLGKGCTVFPFASLGTLSQDLKFKGGNTRVEIGDNTTIREYATVNQPTTEGNATRVGNQCLLMAYTHIAHDCTLGNEVVIANCGTLAGHVTIADQAILGGMVGVHQFVKIGRLAIIGGFSVVRRDVPPFMMATGSPLVVHGLNSIGLKRRGIDAEVTRSLKQAFKILYRQELSVSNAVAKIEAEVPSSEEINSLVDSIKSAERGITMRHGSDHS